MVFRPLLDALLAGAPLEDIRSIVDVAPEEEFRGQALYDVICVAMSHSEFPAATIHSDVFVFLIQQDPSCAFLRQEDGGSSLLYMACICCAHQAQVIQLLAHLDPSAVRGVDRAGYYPLHHALLHGASLETVKILVDLCPEVVRMKTMGEELPLHIAFHYPFHIDLHPDVPLFLVHQYPEGAGAIDAYLRRLPIHYACISGSSLDLIRLLIEAHPNCLQVRDSHGRLPLHIACCCGRVSLNVLLLLLVLYPHGVHVTDNWGQLPLHLARNLDQIRLLVHSDPLTLLCQAQDGSTPLRRAYSSAWTCYR